MNYNNEYKAYYENLRDKVKSMKVKEGAINTFEKELTPIRRSEQAKSYNGSYRNYRGNKETYRYGNRYGNKTKEEKKKFKFIDKIILKLIVTLLLFLCVFIFKISPNKTVKVIYENFNKEINKSYDLTFARSVIDKLGIDLEGVEGIIEKIEDETSEVIKEILE